MSLTIGDKVVVSIDYTLTNSVGEKIDSSEGNGPLKYLHGAGNIIPGLEAALLGNVSGATMQVVVPAAEGYGEVLPELVETVPLSAFQGVEQIEPGMAFEAQGSDGATRRITVNKVEEDQITVDANHPLAGMDLHFDVTVVDVRAASEEEIAHGHAH